MENHLVSQVKNYWIRLLDLPPEKWPSKVVGLGSRYIWEIVEEMLTRVGLTNKIPAKFDFALSEPFREQQVPKLFKETLCERFFISPMKRDTILIALRKISPEVEKLIVAEADSICDHVFDLLGSGPTHLGEKIDWHVDFKTSHRWNPKTYYNRIRPAPYPGGYDIKVPWELSRCQHFVRLGQAYWITDDEKYAREFVSQVEDWIASNPWPLGVNWACTMEVAIRAVNWLWGLAFFLDSCSVSDEFLIELVHSLLVHGCHIMNNPEGSKKDNYTTNHYIADLVGLVYLGICCPFFKEAEKWLTFAIDELWNEMLKQVYPDGVDYEGSIPYHRFVTEMFLSAVLICKRNGIKVPLEVMERLEKTINFIFYVTKPDGTIPIIGDQDNGRLHRLAVWTVPEREWVDYRYLLVLGAVIFQRYDFLIPSRDQWQEALWLLNSEIESFLDDRIRAYTRRANVEYGFFKDGGFYSIRNGNIHIVLKAGSLGTNGLGNHTHNDLLSFVMSVDEEEVFEDSGNFTYTADYEKRLLFRSTACHNTAIVDRLEQSRLDSRRPFSHGQAVVRIKRCEVKDNFAIIQAEHYGYQRLECDVSHQRMLFFDFIKSCLYIQDFFSGEGAHKFQINFCTRIPHFTIQENFGVVFPLRNGNFLGLRLLETAEVELSVKSRLASTSYGTYQSKKSISYILDAQCPVTLTTAIMLRPSLKELLFSLEQIESENPLQTNLR
jgi:hypothetical protein